jgi:hypothetical protein
MIKILKRSFCYLLRFKEITKLKGSEKKLHLNNLISQKDLKIEDFSQVVNFFYNDNLEIIFEPAFNLKVNRYIIRWFKKPPSLNRLKIT